MGPPTCEAHFGGRQAAPHSGPWIGPPLSQSTACSCPITPAPRITKPPMPHPKCRLLKFTPCSGFSTPEELPPKTQLTHAPLPCSGFGTPEVTPPSSTPKSPITHAPLPCFGFSTPEENLSRSSGHTTSIGFSPNLSKRCISTIGWRE